MNTTWNLPLLGVHKGEATPWPVARTPRRGIEPPRSENEDGPPASSHRLTRGLDFSVGSCQPSNFSQCIEGRAPFRRREIDKFRGPLQRRHSGHHKGRCGLCSPHTGTDSGVLMLIEPANEEGPDTSSQSRSARLIWQLRPRRANTGREVRSD